MSPSPQRVCVLGAFNVRMKADIGSGHFSLKRLVIFFLLLISFSFSSSVWKKGTAFKGHI